MHIQIGRRSLAFVTLFSQDLPEAEAHDSRIRAVGYEGD